MWVWEMVRLKHLLQTCSTVIYSTKDLSQLFLFPYTQRGQHKRSLMGIISTLRLTLVSFLNSTSLINIAPPNIRRAPGRPINFWRRGPNEANKGKRHIIVKCKKCNELGNNSRTCGADKGKGKDTNIKTDGAYTSQAPLIQ